MQISGKVLYISAIQKVSEKLSKREIVIQYAESPQYPEEIKFEALNDKAAILDNFRLGQDVEVFFNLRGRAWTDKQGQKQWFNSLQIWKINALGQAPQYAPPVDLNSAPNDDDLPF